MMALIDGVFEGVFCDALSEVLRNISHKFNRHIVLVSMCLFFIKCSFIAEDNR